MAPGNPILNRRRSKFHANLNESVVPHAQDLVTRIEKMEKGAGDKPKQDVVIKDSGVLEVEEPFSIEW